MKIITVIGARPQIIKAAALSRAIRSNFASEIKEVIVHTGQHYDANMSKVFFDEMSIPRPDYNLEVGSGMHGAQTAKMIQGIEEIIIKEKPDCLVVYGDTNSTIAGSLAAAKLHIPVAHIEAGLRSFNKKMPEEINRIACDHMSTFLYVPTPAGIENLKNEGFKIGEEHVSIDSPRVLQVGDIMFDNTKYFAPIAEQNSRIREQFDFEHYVLCTVHRSENTDNAERLEAIFKALYVIANEKDEHIVLPLHPRTRKMMERHLKSELRTLIEEHRNIHLIPPASFLDMINLEKNARLIITDSGGVQKEAYFLDKPCLILRPQTEWVEIVDSGAAKIVDTDLEKIIAAYEECTESELLVFPAIFGDGNAAISILEDIKKYLR